MQKTEKADDSGAGCVMWIGIALITLGGCYVWGPITLVCVGIALFIIVMLAS